MSNRSQSRPWFRFSTIGRSSQPQATTPAAPPPRRQTQPPAPLPRPADATKRLPLQQSAPPSRTPAPVPSAQPRPSPSVTSGAPLQPSRPADANTQRPPLQQSAPPPPQAPAPTPSVVAPPAPIASATQLQQSAPPPPRAPHAPMPSVVAQNLAPAPASAPVPAPAPGAPMPSVVAQNLAPAPAPAPASAPLAASSPPSTPLLTTNIAPRTLASSPLGVPPPPLTNSLAPRTPVSPVSETQTLPSVPTSPAISHSSVSASPKPSSPSSLPNVSTPLKPSPKPSPLTARVPSPAESPRPAHHPLPETPPQSPKNPYFAPPSPFTLPPSQLKSEGQGVAKIPAETEKKTVHVQETIGKPNPFLQSYDSGSQNAHIGTAIKPKQRDFYKKFSDSEDGNVRVITLAGENRGAIMELAGYSYSPIRRRDSEGRSKIHNEPMNAFMNSNVQGINNSIVFNSTCSYHDPGVHLTMTRKPWAGHGHGFQVQNHAKEKGQGFSN